MTTQLKKHAHQILTFCLTLFLLSGCSEDTLKNILNNDKTVDGLKEALKIGTQNATGMLGKNGGYYNDPTVFIDLPPEAKTTIETASKVAGIINVVNSIPLVNTLIQNSGVDLSAFSSDLSGNLISAFNRGAEKAAPQAVNVFVEAISKMSINDGKKILFNSNNEAATDYLKENTSASLAIAFSPIINETISEINVGVGNEKYNALNAWKLFAEQNNKLAELIQSSKFQDVLNNPMVSIALSDSQISAVKSIQPTDTDLGSYVVGKALDGIFTKIGIEEYKIRTDANARVNELLQDVFGQLDN
ncbi:MAG: DUF4197 domain-containing protein [Prevotellaceae bacterium]|jgi:hypothetical protein|nr:DUF4197 domain-containing protein [Prevotellaceae bacterium]